MEFSIITVDGYTKLVSNHQFEPTDILIVLSGPEIENPTRTSIQIGEGRHIEDYYGQFINHSFTPNTYVMNGCIIAEQTIKPGDEITFNYNENETKMVYPFIDLTTCLPVKGKNA